MNSKNNISILMLLVLLFIINIFNCDGNENKYSKEANMRYVDMKDPLRMGKLNIIWEKARKTLSENKLGKLLSELKLQDKEELSLKKLKSHGGDKEGLKEAQLRISLNKILRNYGLGGRKDAKEDEIDATKLEKSIFKDKKLHKLWLKAEQSGLTQEQLKTLKEEFEHHQNKIEEYKMLFEKTNLSPNEIPSITNQLHDMEELEQLEGSAKDYYQNVNVIREKHRELKDGYNKLTQKVSAGPESRDFKDAKVSGLWKLALRSDFNDFELESLYTELKHYEARLTKVTHLEKEIDQLSIGKYDDEVLTEEDREKILQAGKTEGAKILDERLQKQKRKTERLHEHLEQRILSRNIEL